MGCTLAILLISTPLFYILTRHYYAEEMVDMIESVKSGTEIPPSDLEQDIMAGVMIQFGLIVAVLSIASVVAMRLVSKRLWTPFYDTLRKTEQFDLDKAIPHFAATDVREFETLNRSLTELMRRNSDTFKSQKEFTENASHELQTPLAIIRSKLDMLLQQNLNSQQLGLVQNIYAAGNRMARLNRNLLLLAKIDNNQYDTDQTVDLSQLLNADIEQCRLLRNDVSIESFDNGECIVAANGALIESAITNLLVNAIRNTPSGGKVVVDCSSQRLEIANTARSGRLDTAHLFDRFNRSDDTNRGNGIGLSIVKAVCNYHGWKVEYSFGGGMHHFTIFFSHINLLNISAMMR